jgi:DNA-binding response OmpR family regulator
MYVSYDSGQSWWVLGEGLTVVPIGDIEIHPATHELVVGTYGRSMYKIDLDLLPTIVESKKRIVTGFQLEQNYQPIQSFNYNQVFYSYLRICNIKSL